MGDQFGLTIPLTGNPLDRSDNLRNDRAALDALWAREDAHAAVFYGGRPLIDLSPGHATPARPLWLRPEQLGEAQDRERVFLGRLDGEPRFAVDLTQCADDDASMLLALRAPDHAKLIDFRSVARDLTREEAAILVESKSLLDWRAAHLRCARCGAATDLAAGGWRAECPSCGAKHFPRTDPVVIMLLTRRGPDGVDRVALGRQAAWPPGLFSLLAGYVEPGESIEEATRREALEESGLPVGRVVYLASQPWPFPSTLMLGVWAEALGDELKPDLTELEDCLWASRAEMRAVLAGEKRSVKGLMGESEEWMAPRVDAIARTLVEAWVNGAFDALAGPESA